MEDMRGRMKRCGVVVVAVMAVQCAMAFEQELTSLTVGSVIVRCEAPGAWRFSSEIEQVGDKEVVTIELDSDTASTPPRFSVNMMLPQVDVHHLWQGSNGDRCPLKSDWEGYFSSHLSFEMPLYEFLNNNNENRLTVASDESLRRVDALFGLREEGSQLVASLYYFNAPEAPMLHYRTKVMLDARPVFWADAVREGADWMSASAGIVPAEVPESAFEPLYSSWYQFHQNVSDGAIESECAEASAMGMKTIILDDGWQTDDNHRGYAFCGDWQVSKNRFPDMASHVKRVHAMGMKYMLWYSVPFIGRKSVNYERFKGKYLDERPSESVLDPRFPEVREFLCNTYEEAMRRWDLDGFKLDFIDSFTYYNNVDPAESDNYAGRDIKSIPEAVDRLMTDIYRRLRAIKPDVLIEFRQHYTGPAIRQYGNMLRACDCPGDMQANRKRTAYLRLTSGSSAVHSDMLEWNVNETSENAARHILSALFSVIQYSVHLGTLPDDHKRVIRHWLAFTQEHRKTLLQSTFRPYHPENCFPVIEAESSDERIIAVYDDMSTVSVGVGDKPVYIINATGSQSVVADIERTPKSATVYDTYGTSSKVKVPKSGLRRLAIPASGYIVLRY